MQQSLLLQKVTDLGLQVAAIPNAEHPLSAGSAAIRDNR